jgi:hypothetical protein
MIIVRATQKVLNAQRLKPSTIDSNENLLGVFNEWYVNTITSSFRGKSLVIYTHNPSLLTIVITGKTIKKTYPEFVVRLSKLLNRFSFPESFIKANLALTEEHIITKTESKKMLGFMNSSAEHLIARMYRYQSFDEIDFDEEENILMDMIHGSTNFFTPMQYWGNYFLGEDPFGNYVKLNPKKNVIKLIPDENKLSRTEDLHMENQLMKLQIEDFIGGEIISSNNQHIPAEIENLFLKNIIEFEKKSKEIKTKSIKEIIGNYAFKSADTLTEKQLKGELKKIELLLNKKFIQLDFLDKYSDLVKYKFISEEFINHETQVLEIPGMILHFIYEEFHPNADYDIRNRITHFIINLFNPDFEKDSFKYTTKEVFDLNNEKISLDELELKVKHFHLINNAENFSDVKNKTIVYNKLKNKAKITGFIDMKQEGSKVKQKLPVTFYAELTHEWWELSGFNFELL